VIVTMQFLLKGREKYQKKKIFFKNCDKYVESNASLLIDVFSR